MGAKGPAFVFSTLPLALGGSLMRTLVQVRVSHAVSVGAALPMKASGVHTGLGGSGVPGVTQVGATLTSGSCALAGGACVLDRPRKARAASRRRVVAWCAGMDVTAEASGSTAKPF